MMAWQLYRPYLSWQTHLWCVGSCNCQQTHSDFSRLLNNDRLRDVGEKEKFEHSTHVAVSVIIYRVCLVASQLLAICQDSLLLNCSHGGYERVSSRPEVDSLHLWCIYFRCWSVEFHLGSEFHAFQDEKFRQFSTIINHAHVPFTSTMRNFWVIEREKGGKSENFKTMSRGDIETQTMGKMREKYKQLSLSTFLSINQTTLLGRVSLIFVSGEGENFAILLFLLGPIHFQFKPHKSFWLNDGSQRAASWKIAQTVKRWVEWSRRRKIWVKNEFPSFHIEEQASNEHEIFSESSLSKVLYNGPQTSHGM